MAIRFKRKNKDDIIVSNNKLIGIMGDYEKFIYSLDDNNIFLIKREFAFIKDNVYEELLCYSNDIDKYLDIFSLNKEFLNKKIKKLSLSEKRLLKYIEALMSDKKIIVIDEAYLYLDLFYKKKITNLLKNEVKKKTILVGSHSSNDIFYLCDRILLIKDKKHYYDLAFDVFGDNELLKEYGVKKPDSICFVDLCHKKGKKINYTRDIRDLIKEVYKNV